MKIPQQNLKLAVQTAGILDDCNSLLIECLKDNTKKKSEIEDYQLAATYAKEKGHDEKIEFHATVRTLDGKECKPDSLRMIAIATDRFFKERDKQIFHTNRHKDQKIKTSH